MEAVQYVISGGVLAAVVGYFLKREHSSVKSDIRELYEERNALNNRVVKLEGKVESIEDKVPSEIANLERIMDLKFEQFNKQFDELKSAIRHAEKTMTAQADAFVQLFKEIKK